MDPSLLSSNWKRLQASLPKKESRETTSLKRKRPDAVKQRPEKKRQKIETLSGTAHSRSKSKGQMNGTNGVTNHIHKSKSAPSLRSKAAAQDDVTASDNEDDDSADSEPESSSKISEATIAESKDTLNEGVSQTALAGKYIALDCEMVGYGPNPRDDSQLARVSLVNYHGEQIYDSFVLPQVPVTDYRTHITGITAASLKTMGRPFKEVQKDVAAFLGGRVLVGHALKNDLDVLMLSHSRRDIRDTSRHANFRAYSAGKTPALRMLAKEVLSLDIQNGVHSSVEDARMSMLLYRKEKEVFEAEFAGKFGRRGGPSGVEGMDIAGDGGMRKKKKKKGKK
jgi:RNA exonuclease 4